MTANAHPVISTPPGSPCSGPHLSSNSSEMQLGTGNALTPPSPQEHDHKAPSPGAVHAHDPHPAPPFVANHQNGDTHTSQLQHEVDQQAPVTDDQPPAPTLEAAVVKVLAFRAEYLSSFPAASDEYIQNEGLFDDCLLFIARDGPTPPDPALLTKAGRALLQRLQRECTYLQSVDGEVSASTASVDLQIKQSQSQATVAEAVRDQLALARMKGSFHTVLARCREHIVYAWNHPSIVLEPIFNLLMRLSAALAAAGSFVIRHMFRNIEVTLCFALIYLAFCYYDLWCLSSNGQWTTKAIMTITGRDICVLSSVQDPIASSLQSLQRIEDAFDLPVTAPIHKQVAYPIRGAVGKMNGEVKRYIDDFTDGKELQSWTAKAMDQAEKITELAFKYDSSIRNAQDTALYSLKTFAMRSEVIAESTARRSALTSMVVDFVKRVLPSRITIYLVQEEQLSLDYARFTSRLQPTITKHLENSQYMRDQLKEIQNYLEKVQRILDHEIENRETVCADYTNFVVDKGFQEEVRRWLFGKTAESINFERECAVGDIPRVCCRPLEPWKDYIRMLIGNVDVFLVTTQTEINSWTEVEHGLLLVGDDFSAPPYSAALEQGSSIVTLRGRVEVLGIKLQDREQMQQAYWHALDEPWRRKELPGSKK